MNISILKSKKVNSSKYAVWFKISWKSRCCQTCIAWIYVVAKNTIFAAPSKSCLVSGSSVGYHLCLQCRIPTVQYVQSVLDTHSAEHFSKFGCSNSLMLLTHRSQNFLISSERCEEPSTENILLELEQHKLVDSCCSVTNRQLSCAADTTPPHAIQHTVLRMRWDGTGSDQGLRSKYWDMSHVADATADLWSLTPR